MSTLVKLDIGGQLFYADALASDRSIDQPLPFGLVRDQLAAISREFEMVWVQSGLGEATVEFDVNIRVRDGIPVATLVSGQAESLFRFSLKWTKD